MFEISLFEVNIKDKIIETLNNISLNNDHSQLCFISHNFYNQRVWKVTY